MSIRIQSALFMALLSSCLLGCGVEVGNPSEPTPTQPKGDNQPAIPGLPSVPVESIDPVEPSEPVKIDVRYLVESQYDEAITAALDFAFDNTGVALVAGNGTRSCGAQVDGSLILNHQETNTATRTSGQAADATRVTESFSRVFASRMQSAGKTLACNTSLTKPNIDWATTTDVIMDGSLDRTNSRLVVTDPAQQFVRESSVKSKGGHQSSIKKMKFDQATGLQLQRSLVFGTDMEITNRTAMSGATVLKTRMETMADVPLVIEETYNAESKLKSLKINSGAVSSRKLDDGLMVIMRYSNVVLDAQGSCRPTSGTVLGEIYSPENPTQIRDTFSIGFSERQNLIVYADGTASKLEFEPCRIETDGDKSGNGDGSKGGGRN
ncbi:MAG TPA: hypothetical protein VE954_35965 [Oligoflexus sp.]|uniref:hypothetical protein n=1 Tax=Oligoflexus sp. TaxID=1971216 RepID=UPI002D2C86FB|nr:hypothetical protein [Oligoflexus sp.]HYX38530.1 hypothetical protein [Oligoflexus sp.]